MREEKFYEELCPYVERAKQGDQDAFEHLYQSTYDMTKWFVLNFCKDKNEAEDIIQEIYLDVYRYLPDLKNNLAFCAWQRKISYRCCIRFAKHKKDVVVEGNIIQTMEKTAEKDSEPQEVILNNEKNEMLFKCISNLPAKQKAAVIMNGLYQMKMREIAEIMDCDVNAVKNLLYHGKRNLKKQIQELPKADRESLGIRSFGFIIFYPSLRSTMLSSAQRISRHMSTVKKFVITALSVCTGSAALFYFSSDPIPDNRFRSIMMPEIFFETTDLKGIKIPKKKYHVGYRYMNVNKQTKLLEVYVEGKIDYERTYAKTDSGSRMPPLKYNDSRGVLYFQAKSENFILYLTAVDGHTTRFRFYKK